METFQPRTFRSARLQIRFSEAELSDLSAHASELGLPLTAAVRSLALSARAGDRDRRLDELEAVAVACLIASEHALRLLELVTPGGTSRSAELVESVRLSALERVAAIRRDLEEAEA